MKRILYFSQLKPKAGLIQLKDLKGSQLTWVSLSRYCLKDSNFFKLEFKVFIRLLKIYKSDVIILEGVANDNSYLEILNYCQSIDVDVYVSKRCGNIRSYLTKVENIEQKKAS
jgi:hypothetical protein